MKLLVVLSSLVFTLIYGQSIENARMLEKEGAYFKAYQQYEEVYEKSEVKDENILQKLILCAYYSNQLDLAAQWNQKLDPNLRLRENMMQIRTALEAVENDQSFNFLKPVPGTWNNDILDVNPVTGSPDLLILKTSDGFIYNQSITDSKWLQLLEALNQYEIPDAPSFLDENTLVISFGKQIQKPYQNFDKKQLQPESNQLKYLIYENQHWKLSSTLNFMTYGYTYRYPFYDASSKRLFFAMRTDDLNSSFDIYSTIRNEQNEWSQPIDMGTQVNSNFNERFPSVYNDEVYYSSFKNKNKIGNIDLYTFNMKDMTESINAGDTLNSVYHDLKYVATEKAFYVLSNDSKNNQNVLLYKDIKPIVAEDTLSMVEAQPIYDTILLGSIYFELSNTEITDLQPVDDLINKIPDNSTSLIVIGHADHTGNSIKNKNIAAKRSKFITTALQKEGVGLHSHHHGDQASRDHCAENCDDSKHEAFRRVDVFAVTLVPAK